MDERGPLEDFCYNCSDPYIHSEHCHAPENDFLQLKEEFYVELSTYVYIDCLSLFTCSSYYSMRGVVYGDVTAFITLMVCSCNSVP